MGRNYEDWLSAYVQYTRHTEAPARLHFWSGVSALAGALRRHVWFDMGYFKWYPNHYIILVAPPGVVSKSSTSRLSMELLRKVPGVAFGPDSVTWPKLVQDLATHAEMFEFEGQLVTQSALTLHASEFGNLFDPQDRALVDIFVDLWDSITGAFERGTKGDGSLVVENPWLNLIACTTPGWIGNYFPEALIDGGFTSRCLFVYADKKDRLVAYPQRRVPADHLDTKAKLIADLAYIGEKLLGNYVLTAEAEEWGEAWYKSHYENPPLGLRDSRFSGYLARKQTHLHKLAMIISASRRDELIITKNEMLDAATMFSDLEIDMQRVFEKIGRSAEASKADRIVQIVLNRGGMSYTDVYSAVQGYFPVVKDFSDVLSGIFLTGVLKMESKGGVPWLVPVGKVPG